MLKVENLHATFNRGTANEVRAFSGVSLGVQPRSFLVVIGTNGSGKSTLLGAIAGSIPVDSGRVCIDGIDLTGSPEHRRAALIGRVFQNPFTGTAPSMTVGENLALAARRGRPRGLGWALTARVRDEIRERVRRLNMQLEDRIDDRIGTLSGGQRQAPTLLMASCTKPRLLLLDEHTAAPDPKSADQIIQLTEEIIARDRLTTLMVTHSMAQAARLGDGLLMMHRGTVVHHFRGPDRSGRRLLRRHFFDWTAASWALSFARHSLAFSGLPDAS